MKIYVLNTGGTLGMVGDPLRPAKSAKELLEGINIPEGLNLSLEDFPILLDSTNIMYQERIEFGHKIADNYDNHDAFVILHGTDSLAETCAFLSILFKQSLQKSIFVIGAQMTKDEPGSDVPMQIANTLRVCEGFIKNKIVGVYTVSIGDVLDGSRVRKRRDSDFSAFYTPGRYSVAQAWPQLVITKGAPRRIDPVHVAQGLRLDEKFEQQVATYRVSADTPPWILRDIIKARRLKGVILECKGAGNIPDREWADGNETYGWIDVIREATQQGIHVGILSPFEDGRIILERYELGRKAKDAGALSLESLTPEMADMKFRQAIALHPSNPKRIQQFISTDLVGELLPRVEELEMIKG